MNCIIKMRRIVSAIIVIALVLTGFTSVCNAQVKDAGEINILNPENAVFTIQTSEDVLDGSKALDENIVTSATTKKYNGIPIFDINGNAGNDYIMLMTVALANVSPMKRFKMNYEYAMAFGDGTFYSDGGAVYYGETVIPWPEGVEIFVSDNGKTGSWEKVYTCNSLEGKLLEEKREETLWDHSDGIRTYYNFEFDREVTAKYVRLAIRDVQPWLGYMNIPEIQIFGSADAMPSNYKSININAPDCVKSQMFGENVIGKEYGCVGKTLTLKLENDEVSQVNSVKVNGEEVKGKNNEYSFVMPNTDINIDIDAGISDYEDTPLKLVSASVAKGNIVKSDTVPVIEFTFNRGLKWLDKNMVLVDGQENTELVQHAFIDATDNKKAYVAMFSDKLEPGRRYTVGLKDVKSLAGKPCEGWAEMFFTTADDYEAHTEKMVGFVKGYDDGTFRPEASVTVNEALIMAKRIAQDMDFSAITPQNEAATRLDVAEIIYMIKYNKRLALQIDMFNELVKDGIIQGYEDGTYHEGESITRAETAVLFNRATENVLIEDFKETGFNDVPKEHWAAVDIYNAARLDVNTSYDWTQNIQEVEYDVYNKKNNVWTSVPCVSQKQRDMGLSGGEGGQWMQAIECDSVDGQLLFAGVDIGSMIRSTDGGKTWERNYRGFSPKGCVDFEIDPNNKNRVLAVGSLGELPINGIYLSEDMGTTWKQVCSYRINGHRDTRKQLAWDKSSYDETIGGSRIGYWTPLYHLIASHEGDDQNWYQPFSDKKGGLYKTEDGGKTWFVVNEEMSDGVIEVNPSDGTVYIGNENGFFRSTDGGRTFDNVFSGSPIYGLDVIDTRPNNVYINDCKGVMISEDAGKTFSMIESVGFPTKEEVTNPQVMPRQLAVSPANPDHMLVDDQNYFQYNNKRYYSKDGGKTWNECMYDTSRDFFYCQNRQHPFAWHPTDENKVWSFGGDWIATSENAGETFQWDSNGYCGTPPGGRIVFNPYNTDYIFGGAQDLLGILSTDCGYTWKPIEPENGGGFGCSYGSLAFDENLLVSAVSDGWYTARTLKTSYDGGKSFTGTLPLKHGTERRATSFWISPKDPNTAVAGEYITHDRAKTWNEMNGCEFVLAVNYYHNKEMYGLAHKNYDEIIVVSYDDGDTWYPFAMSHVDDPRALDLTASEFSSGIGPHMWDLEYDGKNDILYYLQGSVNNGVVLVRVENNVQTNISSNVEAETMGGSKFMHILAMDPRHPDIIYVGTYGCGTSQSMCAVQRSCDRGETFQVISSMGDPKSIVPNGPSAGSGVETIVVHPKTGELWLWSVAEGMWKFPAPYNN